MHVSKRISEFTFSVIRKLVPYAQKAKDEGVKVYHLNIGQPDIKTPKVALDALYSYKPEIISYGDSQGEKELLNKLAKCYKAYNPNITSDDILITVGGSEALLFTFLTICEFGDEVIIPEPFYTNTGSFAKMAGVDLIPITTSIYEKFALGSIDKFEAKISNKTKAIAICSPNNPTGYVYSDEEILQLLDICERHDLFLICDEVYRQFTYDGKPKTSALKFENYKDRVIVTDSFSKLYSMCGSRIGMLISRNKEVISNALKLSQARLCPPIVDQKTAIAALDTQIDEIRQMRSEYQIRRDTLVRELKKIDNLVTYTPKGAFYVIAELDEVEDAEDFVVFMLKEFRLNNETVFVAPAAGFYENKEYGKKQIRIAYVLNCQDLVKSVKILKEGLKAYLKR